MIPFVARSAPASRFSAFGEEVVWSERQDRPQELEGHVMRVQVSLELGPMGRVVLARVRQGRSG